MKVQKSANDGGAVIGAKSETNGGQAQVAALPSSEEILQLVEGSLDDDKAEDLIVIDLSGKTSIADYMVIASGRSTVQVGAMAEHLREKLKKRKLSVAVEGAGRSDWVLIDAGDIIVHLFRPEVRAFYNLEKMWGSDVLETAGQA
ncbi:ribosome-associated protein [Limibacillus sp. MBR-115]|jgi:ribosome-associated protein